MPTEYSLQELAQLADVSPRTIRFYIEQGLLGAPTQLGAKARYTETHLDRLRVIKKLQAGHLPLAEIRSRLRTLPHNALATVAQRTTDQQPADSALDYINSILGQPARMMARSSVPAPAQMPADSASPPEPDRAQWERITVDPDVELHIRRPLTRQKNKRVERLISIARQLLEED